MAIDVACLLGCPKRLQQEWHHWQINTLVTLVNDSEYSKSTGAKPILSRGCIYLVSPGARCCCCCVFSLLLLKKEPNPWL
jgi:hypothetical protein